MNMNQSDLEILKKEIASSIHCALPANVVSFDSLAHTVVVQPALKRLYKGQEIQMPVLRDVPVFMPVQFNVSVGDPCLVIFADYNIDKWFGDRSVDLPPSLRNHSLSDGFAFVGFFTDGASRGGDMDDYYTKTEVDNKFSDYYKKSEINDSFSNYYDKTTMDTKLAGKKSTQSAVSDPTASGTSITFIDSITQSESGVITPSKKTVRDASQSQSGLMSSTDKQKLDSGIWSVAQGGTGQSGVTEVTTVTDVLDVGTGFSCSNVHLEIWGKMVLFQGGFRATAAHTEGDNDIVFTLKAAYIPKWSVAFMIDSSQKGVFVNTLGVGKSKAGFTLAQSFGVYGMMMLP